jgi:hypothetical protein
MQKIRIISTPPGEAPEAVRRDWINVEIPLPSNSDENLQERLCCGVLSGPKGYFAQLLARIRGQCIKIEGYSVEVIKAVEALAEEHPESAEWWRENTPHLMQPGARFIFPKTDCVVECLAETPNDYVDFYEKKTTTGPQGTYFCLGILSNSDAKTLLEAFDQSGIRYEASVDDSKIRKMNVVIAANGGTTGTGSGITISVHEDDLEKADAIQQKVFNLPA